MADIIDLDRIGAARREAKKDRPVVQYGGTTFNLPVEMPFAVVEAVGRIQRAGDDAEKNSEIAESMADIARSLFGEDYRKFLDLGPSVEDLTALLEELAKAYGLQAKAEENGQVVAVEEP